MESNVKVEQDWSPLWREDATKTEVVECYQRIVNSGDAWKLEGYVGRTAMALIDDGKIMLGKQAHKDYWGSRVPSRDNVKSGSKGSYQYVVYKYGKEYADRLAAL